MACRPKPPPRAAQAVRAWAAAGHVRPRLMSGADLAGRTLSRGRLRRADGRHRMPRAADTRVKAPARLAGPPVGQSYGSCRIRHHIPPMADIRTREAVEKRLQFASITSKNRCTYLRQAAGTDRKERYSGFAGKGRGRVPRRVRGWEQRVRREKEARAGAR